MSALKINFICRDAIGLLFDIVPASKMRPDWWKKLRPIIPNEENTPPIQAGVSLKGCPAVHTFFNAGYVLLSPCDIHIKSDDETYYLTTPENMQDIYEIFPKGHGQVQMNTLKLDEWIKFTVKISTHIHVTSNQPCNILFLNPLWSNIENQPDFVCMNGVMQIDTKSYSGTGHEIVPNFLVRKNTEILIKKGQPLLQVIPFRQENVVAEKTILNSQQTTIFRHYDYVKNAKQVNSHPLTRGFYKIFSFKNSFSLRDGDPKKTLLEARKYYSVKERLKALLDRGD